MEVSRLIERKPITIGTEGTVAEAAMTMREAGVGCLVVTQTDTPVGIITDRDVAVRCTAESHRPATAESGLT